MLLVLAHLTSDTRFPKPAVFSYLTRLEIILHTVLKAFSFGLQRRHDQTVSHKVSRVTDSFTRSETENYIKLGNEANFEFMRDGRKISVFYTSTFLLFKPKSSLLKYFFCSTGNRIPRFRFLRNVTNPHWLPFPTHIPIFLFQHS